MLIWNLFISKIGMQGYGIAYHEDRTVFVPYALPGDSIEAEITHLRKDIAFGRIVRYTEKSVAHQEPGCEAFGPEHRCGGCDWLNCSYEKQLEIKQGLLQGIFSPLLSGDNEILSSMQLVSSPNNLHYRNKVFLPLSTEHDIPVYGIYERFSHRVVRHQNCLLQTEIFDPICQKVMQICAKSGISAYDERTQRGTLRHIGIRSNSDNSEILVILVSKARRLAFSKLLVKELCEAYPQIVGIVQNIQRELTNVIIGNEDQILFGRDYLFDVLGNTRYRVHYRSFYQVNSSCTQLLYSYLKEKIAPQSNLIDAYCGIGTIGLYLSDKIKCVLGIEESSAAILDAKYNAELNQISNTTFICAKVEDWICSNGACDGYDSIIFDPPRKGLEQSIIDALAATTISTIVYVSCNAMTLARDLKRMQEKGFGIDSIQSFEMFPQTWHTESVAILSR